MPVRNARILCPTWCTGKITRSVRSEVICAQFEARSMRTLVSAIVTRATLASAVLAMARWLAGWLVVPSYIFSRGQGSPTPTIYASGVWMCGRCAEQRSACDQCTVNCARKMQSHHGSHRCNVTADDADNGQSPRLAYCLACCSNSDCSKLCQVYHATECRPVRSVSILFR